MGRLLGLRRLTNPPTHMTPTRLGKPQRTGRLCRRRGLAITAGMTYLEAAFLGLVEGLTEFLPISSTGRLMIVCDLLHLEEQQSFVIAIQLGAILAVVALYWRTLLVDVEVLKRVAVALVPTGW